MLCGRYTQHTDSLQRSRTGVLPEHPKGADSQLQGFGISEPLGTFGWNVSSPLCTNYNTICGALQMVPSVPIHICVLNASQQWVQKPRKTP